MLTEGVTRADEYRIRRSLGFRWMTFAGIQRSWWCDDWVRVVIVVVVAGRAWRVSVYALEELPRAITVGSEVLSVRVTLSYTLSAKSSGGRRAEGLVSPWFARSGSWPGGRLGAWCCESYILRG